VRLQTYLSRSAACGLVNTTVRCETTTIGKLPGGTVFSRALSVCSGGELAAEPTFLGVWDRITEGKPNRGEKLFVTSHESKKCVSICDVGLGLNPIKLLPEELQEVAYFWVVKGKVKEVHERGDLTLG